MIFVRRYAIIISYKDKKRSDPARTRRCRGFMDKIGFDSQKYLSMQSECIDKRIREFGGKLYLEFGGKLFDDFHAARVLPGFAPDNKIVMLQELKDKA